MHFRRWLAVGLVAALSFAVAPTARAAGTSAAGLNAAATQCLKQKRVWVVVQKTTTTTTGGCASKFGTGLQALQSAGFSVRLRSDGLITQIGGNPATVRPWNQDRRYWSYWLASPKKSTSTSTTFKWGYSPAGPVMRRPAAGTIEAWEFGTTSGTTPATIKPAPAWTPVTARVPASIAVKGPAGIRKNGQATFQVTVKARGTIPGGTVTVTVAGRSARAALNSKGTAAVKVTKISRTGRQTVITSYSGMPVVNSATAKTSLKVS
ncbi:MAG: hypothetical protein LKI24_17500 [Acidipropionibacterium sp.]|jgi:hypothetical protein|nr:hypothetical protein [Acidipropionibacterium sp.]